MNKVSGITKLESVPPTVELPVTVAAIDDDPESLQLLRDALRSEDLRLVTAANPADGLRLVAAHHPDIVLLDLVMPGVTGMGLLERILAAEPRAAVILITGHYSTESAVEAVQKGASDYLTKPLSVAMLRARVARLAEETRRAPAEPPPRR